MIDRIGPVYECRGRFDIGSITYYNRCVSDVLRGNGCKAVHLAKAVVARLLIAFHVLRIYRI
jgi:hypothetical protein